MKRKYELNLYAPFQYEDIQSHLEEMAERGWALEEARRASEEGAPGPRGRMSLPWKITLWLTAVAGVGTLALFVGIAVSDHGPMAAVRIAGAALVFYVTLYAAFRFRDLLRKQGGSPHWKWIVFTIVAVLLALLDVGLRDWLTDF